MPKKKTALRNGTRYGKTNTSRAALTGVESEKSWTFLTNHAHVLVVLNSDEPLILREVADRVGITERAVQRIVHELEEQGFIERHRIGRKNHYKVNMKAPLRHPIEQHRSIGDLLDLINH